jgi:hypothetical protein
MPSASGLQKHVYIIRAIKGETARLGALAAPAEDNQSEKSGLEHAVMVPVIINGPSGGNLFRRAGSSTPTNVFAVAGGTGISFALPAVEEALIRAESLGAGAVTLVWVIRKTRNVEWVAPELASLRARLASSRGIDFHIQIYVTRDSRPLSTVSIEHTLIDSEKNITVDNFLAPTDSKIPVVESLIADNIPSFKVTWLVDHHPNFTNAESSILDNWLQRGAVHGGSFHVFASGSVAMGTDLRIAVARRNDPSAVWKGNSEGDVEFYWDDRCS